MAFHHGRIACGERVRRYVAHHHTACRYDATVADGDARTHRHAATQPAVVANGDGQTGLYGLHALYVVDGVLRRVEAAARAYLAVVSDA